MDWSARRRRQPTDDPEAGWDPLSRRTALPSRFEAVRDALASGSGSVVAAVPACEVLGARLAREGISLAEALDDLALTWRLVAGAPPPHEATRALAVAWSEATLGYLHGVSCEDPLTGLASLAHVRTVVTDLRRSGPVHRTHALVVIAVERSRDPDRLGEALSRAMTDAQVGATVRSVFPGRETIGHLAPGRLVVLAQRDERLLRRFDLLLRMVDAGEPPRPRAWIETLPDTDPGVAALLDELARG